MCPKLTKKSPDLFEKEILQIWSETSYEDNLNSIEYFSSMSLWHTSLIRIENRPVYYKELYFKGITKVSQLMEDTKELRHSIQAKNAECCDD